VPPPEAILGVNEAVESLFESNATLNPNVVDENCLQHILVHPYSVFTVQLLPWKNRD
jgi:hypothetical protein